MKEALRLAPVLTLSRLKTRRGDAWLDLLAIVSFALSTLMALTVAGGIWMFIGWRTHPTPEMMHVAASAWGYGDTDGVFSLYVSLAYVAGALLVFPIFSLGASAVRLGARGRSQRLASLRLVGLTSGQTLIISLVETVIQWFIGTAIGLFAYGATLPLWRHVRFLEQPIRPSDMLLPTTAIFAVIGIVLLLALSSTIAGLQRIWISPLGVARREVSPGLTVWRPIVFVLGIAAFVVWTRGAPSLTDSATYIALAGMILVVVAGIALVGPWIIQLISTPLAITRRVPRLLAARRILDDPKAAWRNISGITLLCFIVGFVAVMPDQQDSALFQHDVLTGIEITLAFGFAVAALSTLMNQSSMIFDRARQTYALAQIGFPHRVFSMTRVHQVMGPLLLATAASAALGVLLSIALFTMPPSISGLWRITATLIAGLAMSAAALAACEPLERRVLASQRRAND